MINEFNIYSLNSRPVKETMTFNLPAVTRGRAQHIFTNRNGIRHPRPCPRRCRSCYQRKPLQGADAVHERFSPSVASEI